MVRAGLRREARAAAALGRTLGWRRMGKPDPVGVHFEAGAVPSKTPSVASDTGPHLDLWEKASLPELGPQAGRGPSPARPRGPESKGQRPTQAPPLAPPDPLRSRLPATSLGPQLPLSKNSENLREMTKGQSSEEGPSVGPRWRGSTSLSHQQVVGLYQPRAASRWWWGVPGGASLNQVFPPESLRLGEGWGCLRVCSKWETEAGLNLGAGLTPPNPCHSPVPLPLPLPSLSARQGDSKLVTARCVPTHPLGPHLPRTRWCLPVASPWPHTPHTEADLGATGGNNCQGCWVSEDLVLNSVLSLTLG